MKIRTPRALPLRLLAYVLIPLLACTVGAGVLVLRELERQFEARMEEDVELVARALQRPVSHALEHGHERTLKRALEAASHIGRVYGASIYDDGGRLVAALGRVDHRRRPDDLASLTETKRGRGRYGQIGDEAVYAYFVPVRVGPDEVGVLEVTRRKEDINQFMADLRLQALLLLGAGVLVLTGIVLVGYRAAVGGALERLRRSIERVQAGDVAHRAERRGPREVAVIVGAFNAMLDSIREAEERIDAERQQRANLQIRLAESEKLAAVGQLAAGIAHELGTPLATVRGRVQRVLRSQDLSDSALGELRRVADEAVRIERLVRQVLEYSRNESGTRAHVSADKLAAMASSAVREEAETAGVTLALDGTEPAPVLYANLVRAEQALVNLLRNAVQATGPGGHVALRWQRNDGYVTYDVTDDGAGIPDEVLPHIFDPFFTTKRDRDGTGLGLGIVQAVAREHDGRVEVFQLEPRGARFRLWLPMHGEQRLQRSAEPRAPEDRP